MPTQHEETVYERLGEFHDLFMEPTWARLRPHMQTVFGHLDRSAAVAEIGAGTGLGVRTLAAVSDTQIWALEPSLVMRATLTARIADDPELCERVTILAGPAPASLRDLPERIDGVVCANMLGHLDVDERHALFAWLAAHLSETGTCLVTTQEPAGSTRGSRIAEISEARSIGSYEYRATYLESGETGSFSTRYEVWDGTTRLRAETYTGRWHVLSAQQLGAELAGTRLAIQAIEPGIALIRRA
ncbi:class I SAM-dependent methyltransferase [Microbacterium sp. NPDC087589]|uniref:class I SAM-dependent methyltransferase n=1 Tax=Microbacterium sp. NPDC087589 TaxID=3364191 RepID=UPI00380B78C8